MPYLEVKNVTKRFENQIALKSVSVEAEKGELVCILGPSGCGKTTLLRIIAGLESADSGSVVINGKDCTYLPPTKRNFGIVFQSYALFPNMTVKENILFGLRQKKELGKSEIENRAAEVLRLVGLYEHKNKYPLQLSGGQQQRTALARAIALSPVYLLLDEPLSALDAKVRAKLRGDICHIQRSLGITTIMVTHDQEEALTMSDRIIVMNNAVVEQVGTPREIYDKPLNPFVANFIGTINFYKVSGGIFAIRPEKIELTTRKEHYDHIAEIKRVEFKGALTRIYGQLPQQTEICVDVPSRRADEIGIKKNGMMFLKFPAEHTIKYSV
ncbi:MAG: ATP-binding cassette domain-containing protein [Deferribacteraceae bacterium]|jgi:iron(III) transport system ATP-binding protein|nr:ATP-binding cassette domain-containing protein [Deferribacteraceae bacterium]